MTPFTLVRLLATVHTLVAFQMVLLDEAHVTYITFKWLLTSMNEDVPLEVVAAPKGSKAVFTSKIFWYLYLERTILFHYYHLGRRLLCHACDPSSSSGPHGTGGSFGAVVSLPLSLCLSLSI